MQPLKAGSFRTSLLMFLATMADIYDAADYTQIYKRLRWPGYPETSVRGMVRRMLKEKELVQVSEGFGLGLKGKELVGQLVPVRRLAQNRWDGLWRVIAYHVPEGNKLKRNQLRLLLLKYGYANWQKSVYLSPHPVTLAVIEELKARGMYTQAICLESQQVGGLNNRHLAGQIFNSRERLAAWERLVGEGYMVLRTEHGVGTWVKKYEDLLVKEPWLPKDLEGAGLEVARHKAAIIMQKLVS